MLNELVILFAAMDWITIVLLCVGMAMSLSKCLYPVSDFSVLPELFVWFWV